MLTQAAWFSILEERPEAELPESVSRDDRAALAQFFDAYCLPPRSPDAGLLPPMFTAMSDGGLTLHGVRE